MLALTATVTEARQTLAELPWESPTLTPGTVARGQEEEEEVVATAVLHQVGLVLAHLRAVGEKAAMEVCPLPAELQAGVAATATRAMRWTALVLWPREVDRRPTAPGVVLAPRGPRSRQRALPTVPSPLPRPPTRAPQEGGHAADRPSAIHPPPRPPWAMAPSSRLPAPGEEGAGHTAEALPPPPRRGVPLPCPCPTSAMATTRHTTEPSGHL